MELLTEIPPKVRKVLYVVLGMAALAAAAVQIGFLTAGTGDPLWLKIALAVIAFLNASLHATAASNVTASVARRGRRIQGGR